MNVQLILGILMGYFAVYQIAWNRGFNAAASQECPFAPPRAPASGDTKGGTDGE